MKYIFVLFPILFYNFIFSNIAICNVKENKQKNKDILTINTTENNLKDSIEGEKFEYEHMYKDFAKKAKEEGFDDIAEKFLHVAEIEKKKKKKI